MLLRQRRRAADEEVVEVVAAEEKGLRRTAAGTPPKGTDSQEFLKKQEEELIEIVRERAKLREENEARPEEGSSSKAVPARRGRRQGGWNYVPSGTCVIAMVNEAGNGSKPQNVPSYVNESAYTEDIGGRTNVGDTQGRQRVAILDVRYG